jgi:Spy/CpxP family protein refolding chaperone
VQKEIGAGDAEKAKIEAIGGESNEARREELSAAGVDFRNFQNLSDDERRAAREKLAAATKKVNDKFEPKLKEALSAEQFKRLQEIHVQAAGIDALTDSRVAKELALTDEQTKKIADVRADYRQKQQALGRDAGQDARRDLRQEETKKATEVLTAEQQEKLTALKGKEFDRSQLRGGRGDGNQGAGNRRRRPQQEN